MNIREFLRLGAFALMLVPSALWAEEAPSFDKVKTLAPLEHFDKVAKRVGMMLPSYHVTRQQLNDEISQRAWTNLVTMYDYNHCVLLKSDLDRFEPMKTRIDDCVREGDVSFAYDLHKVFVQRLDECITFVTNYLEKSEIDFSVDESYVFNRKDEPWPETVEARNDIWRRRIKNELLLQMLGRELDAEEDAEAERAGKKKKDRTKPKKPHRIGARRVEPEKPEPSASSATNSATAGAGAAVPEKPEPTPKENLLNKYRHYLAWVLTEMDEEKVMERYMLAVAMAYDPHTAYMAPASKEEFDMGMSLQLVGVGAVLSQSLDDGALEIKEIMKGSPISRASNVKEGDRIVAVAQGDGEFEDVVWKPMRKSIRKIRGRKNTKVVLEITDKNGNSRRRVPIIRDVIKLEDQAATGRVEKVVLNGVTNTMGYVKLPTFYGTMGKKPNQPGYRSCSLDVAKWVAKFNTQGTDGMILDLRGNGGGSLPEAVLLSQLFVRPNPGPCPIVQIRETRNLYVLPTFPDQPTFAYRKPLVVLVDRHSASASEIVACALQDTGRAIVIGDTQSHGKGTVQTLLPMGREDFGSMKITSARFYRINGSSTQVKGVASDIRLPSVFDERTDIGEDKLPNALPWSSIQPASYDAIWNLCQYVPQLRELSAARVAKSEEWKRRFDVIKLFKEASERRVASLERNARKKQMKDERAALEAADEEDFDDDDDLLPAVIDERARKRDIVLTEALNVLADLVRLTRGEEAPPASPTNDRIPAWLRSLQKGVL